MPDYASLLPDLASRNSITLEQLARLDEPAGIFEYMHVDSDGVPAYVYTVAGWLNGRNVASQLGGATVGGDVIVVHAKTRAEADEIAAAGLGTTIDAVRQGPGKDIGLGINADRRPQGGTSLILPS